MLAFLTLRVREQTSVLDRFLSLCDACDEATADAGGALHAELAARSIVAPNLTEEKIFRHCATVNRLYGVYENFVEAVLAFWLARLPRYRDFSDLPDTFRNAYRMGISRIIRDSEARKYRRLAPLGDVLAKYVSSLRGESPWELVEEALTTHDRNLRRSEFENMFNSVGLEGAWSILEGNPSVDSLTVKGGANNSLEKMILNLVTYRNDASHGTPDDILSADTLREWIEFVKAFCDALAAFVTHRIVREEALHRPEAVYGVVTETFRDNVAVITCDRGNLRVGDHFFFLRESDCTHARINSLQVNDVSRISVVIEHDEFEVGIQTSVGVPCKARLVRVDDYV